MKRRITNWKEVIEKIERGVNLLDLHFIFPELAKKRLHRCGDRCGAVGERIKCPFHGGGSLILSFAFLHAGILLLLIQQDGTVLVAVELAMLFTTTWKGNRFPFSKQ